MLLLFSDCSGAAKGGEMLNFHTFEILHIRLP